MKKKNARKTAKRAAPGTGTHRAALRSLKARLHKHSTPKCTGTSEDPSCKGKGTRVSCNQVSFLGHKLCVCLHVAN